MAWTIASRRIRIESFLQGCKKCRQSRAQCVLGFFFYKYIIYITKNLWHSTFKVTETSSHLNITENKMNKFFVCVLFLLSLTTTTVSTAGPVTFVQQSSSQQAGPVYSDSANAELCKFEFIANFPEHGATTMYRLLVVILKFGQQEQINWDYQDPITGEFAIDRTFKNLSIKNDAGTELVFIPTLSQCVDRTLLASLYTCDVALPGPINSSGLITLTTRVDIEPNAGRFGETTYLTHLFCGYGPPTNPNVVGGFSGQIGFAPEQFQYGAQRSYVWRQPLLSDGFE